MLQKVASIGFSAASRLCREPRLSILVFHRVLSEPDPLRTAEITEEQFRWQMELVAKNFNAYKLSDAVARLHDGSIARNAICVTFDDGYADNYLFAYPVLKTPTASWRRHHQQPRLLWHFADGKRRQLPPDCQTHPYPRSPRLQICPLRPDCPLRRHQ